MSTRNFACNESVTAVGIFEHRWKGFYRAIVRRKRELLARIRCVHGVVLDLDSAEIKSNWVRIPKERQKHRFLSCLTEPDLTALVSLYFEQLAQLPSVVISVVIDKRHLRQPASQEWMHAKAWEYLCERIEMFMWRDHPRHRAVLIADDMGKQQNCGLAMRHARFLENATTARRRLRENKKGQSDSITETALSELMSGGANPIELQAAPDQKLPAL